VLYDVTLVSQTVLFLYWITTTLVDFYPFNNVRTFSRRERVLELGVNIPILAAPPLMLLLHVGEKGPVFLFYAFLIFGEFMTWWRPYFFGPSKAWRELYDRTFASTIKVLPPIADHPVPNLEHTLLHGATLITLCLSVANYLSL
jgi:hypothetical protein